MAVVSNVKKFTIKHIKEEGEGLEIPVYPSSIVPSDNLITKSWNNMNGVFVDIPINLKRKINWIFDVVSREQLDELYGRMITDKIIKYKSRYFIITTDFPGVGFITGTFYLGTPTSFKSLYGTNNSVSLYSLELHWIEVDGILLNSPLTTTPE